MDEKLPQFIAWDFDEPKLLTVQTMVRRGWSRGVEGEGTVMSGGGDDGWWQSIFSQGPRVLRSCMAPAFLAPEFLI